MIFIVYLENMYNMKILKVVLFFVFTILISFLYISNIHAWTETDTPIHVMTVEGFTDNGEFNSPSDIFLDSNGNMYVADSLNYRIQKFNSSGQFLMKFGSSGNTNGKFVTPYNLTLDASGNIYVADTGNHRIQKFNSSGEFIMSFGSSGTGDGQFNSPRDLVIDNAGYIYVVDRSNRRIQKFNSTGEFQMKFGSSGTGDGQFTNPTGIAVDSSGNIYVADSGNHRIQKFNSSGTFLFTFGWGVTNGTAVLQFCTSGCRAGVSGSGDGQLNSPSDITLDSSGNMLVVDYVNNRIQKFTNLGGYIDKFGSYGTADGQLRYPNSIYLDNNNGDIYITDSLNHRVQKFNSSYTFQMKFGSNIFSEDKFYQPWGMDVDSNGSIFVADDLGNRVVKYNSTGQFEMAFGSYGTGNGQFNEAEDVAVDNNGNIYVTDYYNYRVQKFNSSGEYLMQFGSYGTGDGQFKLMHGGIVCDDLGNVYIVDNENSRIQKFNSSGQFLMKFSSYGTTDGLLKYPIGISLDGEGNIYVGDQMNHRVEKFNSSGNFIFVLGWGVDDGTSELQVCTSGCQAGIGGANDGQFQYPRSVVVDQNNNIFVIDSFNNRVQKFDSNGNFLMKFGSTGALDGEFRGVYDIVIDNSGNLYILENGNHRVQKFSFDRTSPTANISIAGYTTHVPSPNITLNLAAWDNASGVYQMRVSQNSDFSGSAWEAYSSTKSVTLSSGDGLKTIYTQFVDNKTNYSDTISKGIYLDTQVPSKVKITDIGLADNILDRDNITYYFLNNILTVKGIAEFGSAVTFVGNGKTYTAVGGVGNVFSLSTINPTLSMGTNTFEYYQTDLAGNRSESRYISIVIGVENFPEWLIDDLGLNESEEEPFVEEETPNILEEENEEPVKEEIPESNIQTLQFTDKEGKPLVNAFVTIEGTEYFTDSNGQIQVVGLEKDKKYKVKIEHNGIKYESEVLGASGVDSGIKVTVTEDNISKGIDWKSVLIYSGIGLVLIFFLILIFRKRKDREENLD